MNNLYAGFWKFITGKSKSKNHLEKGFTKQSPAFEILKLIFLRNVPEKIFLFWIIKQRIQKEMP